MTTITLTIAGSDSGGGAGIQADLKTFQELDTFGTSVITAITAQNTTGVHGVEAVSLEMIDAQMEAVCKDLRPHSLKTGMLFSDEIIALVSQKITDYQLTNVVVDPVMIAKGGASLLQEQAIQAMKEQLLPLATIITPNLPEAEVLAGMTISSEEDIHLAAQKIAALGPAYTVIKGGHHTDPDFATDYIFQQNQLLFTVQSRRVPT
ncbi:MAG TPA: bifunctional hydroxymethylpyrimidine kinase/phosphomethylpyrimidine kinase, partial [Savagea sp.]